MEFLRKTIAINGAVEKVRTEIVKRRRPPRLMTQKNDAQAPERAKGDALLTEVTPGQKIETKDDVLVAGTPRYKIETKDDAQVAVGDARLQYLDEKRCPGGGRDIMSLNETKDDAQVAGTLSSRYLSKSDAQLPD